MLWQNKYSLVIVLYQNYSLICQVYKYWDGRRDLRLMSLISTPIAWYDIRNIVYDKLPNVCIFQLVMSDSLF
jgi:hypothetical protein